MEIIEFAVMSDVHEIENMYNLCKETLNQKGIYQWDDYYPSRTFFIDCIKAQELYVIKNDDIIVGSVILNDYQVKEWKSINWNIENDRVLVIHALAINPLYQGYGYGKKLLKFCESYGSENNYKTIRLDAFSENPIALNLYERNGYIKTGEVEFSTKPKGHQKYYCYERSIEC